MTWQRKEIIRRDISYLTEHKGQRIEVSKDRILIEGNLQIQYQGKKFRIRQIVHCFESGKYERSSYRTVGLADVAEFSGYELKLESDLVTVLNQIRSTKIKSSIADALKGAPIKSSLYEKYGKIIAEPLRL